jgi:pilus assembly protein Flp/PilA
MGDQMTNIVLHKLYLKFQILIGSDDGQDLVEYAMVCALLAFGIVAGMSSVAKGLDTAFSNVSSTLGTYTT